MTQICPREDCKHQNADTAQYCIKCGTPLRPPTKAVARQALKSTIWPPPFLTGAYIVPVAIGLALIGAVVYVIPLILTAFPGGASVGKFINIGLLIAPLPWLIALILIFPLLTPKVNKIYNIFGVILLVGFAAAFWLYQVPNIMAEASVSGFIGCISGNPSECELLFSGPGVGPQVPEGQKTGSYQVLDVQLGSKTKGIPPVIFDQIYELPITIAQGAYIKESEKTVNDIKVEYSDAEGNVLGQELSMICNTTKSGDDEFCYVLVPDDCKKVGQCSLTVNSRPKEVILSTQKHIDFKENSILKIYVYTSYPFYGTGSNEFYIAIDGDSLPKDKKCLDKKVDISKPCNGPGPLDITLFFPRSYYIKGDAIKNPERAEVTLSIDVANKASGFANIQDIELVRQADISGFEIDGTCSLEGTSVAFEENKVTTLGNLPLRMEHMYKCKYKITEPLSESLTLSTIPFEARLNYKYTEKTTPSTIIRVQQKGYYQ